MKKIAQLISKHLTPEPTKNKINRLLVFYFENERDRKKAH